MIDKKGVKWVEIDLDAFAINIKHIAKMVKPAKLMAVIKADGYGHGAIEIATVAKKNGVKIFGVSCLEEAIELRQNFIKEDILVFGSIPESQICDIINYNITPTVCTLSFANNIAKEVKRLKKDNLNIHICIDTGMGRVGPLYDDALNFVLELSKLRGITIDGLYSHFSTADEENSKFTKDQEDRFSSVVSSIKNSGIKIPTYHLSNSGGILNFPNSYYNMVRAGLLIYGINPTSSKPASKNIESIFSLKVKVAYVKSVQKGFSVGYGQKYITKKSCDIITLPLGYADGIPRKFSDKGSVLINGEKFPIIGSVCMDMIMVEAPINSNIKISDEVVIIGSQGDQSISVYDVAQELSTIPYEIICNIGKRLTRVYKKKNKIFSIKRMISEF